MKKIILSLIMVSAFMFANAQLTSKKGEPILPESGDWAISVCAEPFLEYFGGFLSNAGAKAPTFDFLDGTNYIAGKYFVDANKAFRGKLRIGLGSNSNEKDPTFGKKSVTSYTNVTLGAGMEMRKGKTRLQGLYGAEALIQLGGGKDKYTYDNVANGDITEVKKGSTFSIGVRGFIGAEYFVLPKLSIGAEYGWGLMLNSTGEGVTKRQGADDVKTGKTSNFGLDTDISPEIVLSLYF